jgi:ubiquitin-protein ligase
MSNKMNALKRIQKDLEKVYREDDPGFVVNFENDNMFNVTALLAGPEGTIWEDGCFEMSIKFSDEYPNKCP